MRHGDLDDILDELKDSHDELFITGNSKHAALITFRDGSSFLIEGDFSGTDAENEAEARRILRANRINRAPRRARREREGRS